MADGNYAVKLGWGDPPPQEGWAAALRSMPAWMNPGGYAARLLTPVAQPMVQGAINAAALPGDVYAGRVDPNSDVGIGRATDLAGMVTLGAGAVPAGAGTVRAGMGKVAADLPMDTASRMDRATKGNFDPTTFYHATDANFSAFDKKAIGKDTNFGSKAEKAFFLTSDPKVAEDFISPFWFTRDGKTVERAYVTGGNVMPLRVRDMDQFDFWDMGGGTYTPEFMRDALRQAKKDGKKGVVFQRMRDFGIGTTGNPRPSHVVAVFDPSLIRSTAAKFDPAMKKSPDILSSIAGAGLIAAGGGAAVAQQLAKQAGVPGEVY